MMRKTTTTQKIVNETKKKSFKSHLSASDLYKRRSKANYIHQQCVSDVMCKANSPQNMSTSDATVDLTIWQA